MVRPQPRTRCATLSTPLLKEGASFVDPAAPSDVLVSFSQAKADTDSTSGFESTLGKEEDPSHLKKLTDEAESLGARGRVERFSAVSDTVSSADINGDAQQQQQQQQPVKGSNDGDSLALSPGRTDFADQEADQNLTSSAAVSEGDSGIEPCAEGGEDDGGPGSPGGSQTGKSAQSDVAWTPAEQQDKKKGETVDYFARASRETVG